MCCQLDVSHTHPSTLVLLPSWRSHLFLLSDSWHLRVPASSRIFCRLSTVGWACYIHTAPHTGPFVIFLPCGWAPTSNWMSPVCSLTCHCQTFATLPCSFHFRFDFDSFFALSNIIVSTVAFGAYNSAILTSLWSSLHFLHHHLNTYISGLVVVSMVAGACCIFGMHILPNLGLLFLQVSLRFWLHPQHIYLVSKHIPSQILPSRHSFMFPDSIRRLYGRLPYLWLTLFSFPFQHAYIEFLFSFAYILFFLIVPIVFPWFLSLTHSFSFLFVLIGFLSLFPVSIHCPTVAYHTFGSHILPNSALTIIISNFPIVFPHSSWIFNANIIKSLIPVKYVLRAAELDAAARDGIGIRDGTGVRKGTKWEERTCYQGITLGPRISQS